MRGYIWKINTLRWGNKMPTKKLDNQLTVDAIDMAAGLGPWLNSSAVIIHGMEPGPTAKKTTNDRVATTATYFTQSMSS